MDKARLLTNRTVTNTEEDSERKQDGVYTANRFFIRKSLNFPILTHEYAVGTREYKK